MAIKHQSQCYRTFAGVRWPNLCDLCGPDHEAAATAVRKAGYRIKVQAHPDGFRRAFIHIDDLAKAAAVFNEYLEGDRHGE
ncbi:hypothetical protein Brsp07_01088 [Brucella sp. NBRC 14130]|uniref:hypothetical protein n=1 Tax=Brucella sp. NBRC 14130 TaxID=3075483 RepID=UPI0030A4FE6E